LTAVDAYADALLSIGDGAPPEPRWSQDWFPRADAAVAYTVVRTLRPARLIEIGAGHSTRWFARAIRDGGLSTQLITIDPAPRASVAALDATWIPASLQNVDLVLFDGLARGDIVSIDSSHILMPDTDADRFFTQILPSLPAGVGVHIHDVFLPDDYPEAWAWRAYNEQLAVALLLAFGSWRPFWASHYVVSRMPTTLESSMLARLPLPAGAFENSIWLMRPDRTEPVHA
jgi:predicted O-methyltransferase YrrM